MITLRDLLEQEVHLQGDTINLVQWNETREVYEDLVSLNPHQMCEYEIECRKMGHILDWEVTYIYPQDNALCIELKGE